MTDDLLHHISAVRHGVVKWRHFLPVYERLLAPYRGTAVTLVEVGVGEGGSLEAWRAYMGPSARIVGIDCDPSAKQLESEGFEIIVGDQANPDFWTQVAHQVGPIDVLIDDGGHSSVQQIVTVACGLRHVRDGGVIVVEDTHTSYLPKQYPSTQRFGFMQFAQHVIDAMHNRNPDVTVRVPDDAGFADAVHRVEFIESMAIFHVDRRLCGTSQGFEAGADGLVSLDQPAGARGNALRVLESQPAWLRALLQPARLAVGMVLRRAAAHSSAARVRRYFQ
jgi:hypothetical protein